MRISCSCSKTKIGDYPRCQIIPGDKGLISVVIKADFMVMSE